MAGPATRSMTIPSLGWTVFGDFLRVIKPLVIFEILFKLVAAGLGMLVASVVLQVLTRYGRLRGGDEHGDRRLPALADRSPGRGRARRLRPPGHRARAPRRDGHRRPVRAWAGGERTGHRRGPDRTDPETVEAQAHGILLARRHGLAARPPGGTHLRRAPDAPRHQLLPRRTGLPASSSRSPSAASSGRSCS